jgi:hypothetical protein
MDTLKARQTGFVHSNTDDEALDDIEFEHQDMIVVRCVSVKHMFIMQNGQHRTVPKAKVHNILICKTREDAWEDQTMIVEGENADNNVPHGLIR